MIHPTSQATWAPPNGFCFANSKHVGHSFPVLISPRSGQHLCVKMSKYLCILFLRHISEGENPMIKRSHLIALLLIISVLIVVITQYFSKHSYTHYTDTKPRDLKIYEASTPRADHCTTDICSEEAFRIKSNIKQRVNPCDDFYDFACGGWEKSHPIPPEENSWNQLKDTNNITTYRVKEILEKDDKQDDIAPMRAARKFYQTCLATYANIQPSFDMFLKKLSIPGGWPMVNYNWDSEKFDWQSLIVELERTTKDVSPLFKIDVVQNPKNTSLFTLHLAPSPSPDLCQEFHKIKSLDGLPLHHPLTATAQLISNLTKETFPDSSEDDVQTLKFAREFCEISKKALDSDPYSLTSLGDFQAMSDNLTLTKTSSKVNWTSILSEYVRGSEIEFTEEDVVISESDVILDIIKLIDNTPERTLANYIYLHKIRWIKSFYSEEASQDRKLQEKSCVFQTREMFPHAIGREYVREHFSEDDRTQVTYLMQQIQRFFSSDVFNPSQGWMDSTTRHTAIDKARHMSYIVGYPHWYKNISMINEMYSRIHLGDSHIENLESGRLGHIFFRLKFLHEKADRTLFVRAADQSDAAYSLTNNLLQIPAGIIQPPYYVKGRPPALNFGSLASIIAREITHAFDIEGRQTDKYGNAANWWSKSTFDAYTKKAECFEKQYSNFSIRELEGMNEKHRHLDGHKTLSENLADNGGLEAAFGAYQKFYNHKKEETFLSGLAEYTPQQLFFIGYASNWCESSSWQSVLNSVLFDPHSPSKYRVLIPLINSEEFARVWNCPSRLSNMTNKPRCHFWLADQPEKQGLEQQFAVDFQTTINASLDKLINATIEKINKGGIYTVSRNN